jgi:hypothetical protein
VAWPQLGAQANAPSSPAQRQTNEATATDNRAPHTVTVTGCLRKSQANGAFTLTDTSGREFVLAGNTGSLVGHSQQEVQITGQQAFSSTSETNTSSSSAAEGQASESHPGSPANQMMIEVTETKIISDHCSSSAGAHEKPSGEASDPPAEGANSPASSATARDPGNVQSTGRGETGTEGARELPQTSTILPLLGLIGLGSLVAGFFARR